LLVELKVPEACRYVSLKWGSSLIRRILSCYIEAAT
jgi:hypothetical protein